MTTETEILQLALLAYEAAADPPVWPRFLERYAGVLNADLAFLQLHDCEHRRSKVLAGFGIPAEIQRSYDEQYSVVNIWRERGERLFRVGGVLQDEEICPRDTLARTEFYNDHLIRLGATRSLSGVIALDGRRALSLPAMRAESRPTFGAEDRSIAERLLPHLAKADIIRSRFEVLEAGQQILDELPYGVAFLTAEGRVIYFNFAAESALRDDDGMVLRHGFLCADSAADNSVLKSSIREMGSPGVSLKHPKPLLLQRKSSQRPYQILLAPLRRRFSLFSGMVAPVIVALIIDPEKQPAAVPEVLEALYGLTKTEALVAARLAEGKSLEELADELGMRYETARTHLKRIFDKTGTSRQAALMKIIEQLPKHRTRTEATKHGNISSGTRRISRGLVLAGGAYTSRAPGSPG